MGSGDDEHNKALSPHSTNVLNLKQLRQLFPQLRQGTFLAYFLTIKDSLCSESEKNPFGFKKIHVLEIALLMME